MTLSLNFEDGLTSYRIFEAKLSRWARHLSVGLDNPDKYIAISKGGGVESLIGFNITDVIFNFCRELLFDQIFIRFHEKYLLVKVKAYNFKLKFYSFYLTYFDLLTEVEHVSH